MKLSGTATVQEVKELKDKQGSVWKKLLRAAYMGGVVELTIPAGFDAALLVVGKAVELSANLISGYQGRAEFVLEAVKPGR